jgi:HAD superfamily hydrolase (TIGR01549 family)
VADTAIFDVDGTLVDTNYQHALAWFRAFRRFDITRPLWRIHRGIGMGGDTFVPEVGGAEVEEAHGDALRDAWVEEFDLMIEEIQPFEGARELLQEVKDRGFRLVLASSGKTKHVDRFLDLIDAKDLADAYTTSEDAETSKPAPDIVKVALAKVEGASGVMVGDSVYDVQSAHGRLRDRRAAKRRCAQGLRLPRRAPRAPRRDPARAAAFLSTAARPPLGPCSCGPWGRPCRSRCCTRRRSATCSRDNLG